MGYKIPGPDYTLPPAQFSWAAEAAKGVASGIREYTRYRREQQEEAGKLAQAELEFKNTLFINQAKTLGTFNKKAKEALGEESELYEQFTGIVRDKAKQAMAASVAMQFDKNLSDEERAGYAQTVADFDTYTSSSMEQLGGLIADYNAFVNKDDMKGQVVVGNPMNGERFFNEITLVNLGGRGPAMLDTDTANFSRTVEPDGNNNIVTSVVRLPKNHPAVLKHKQYIEKGLLENGGKYTYGSLTEEDGMYVFKSVINAGVYGTQDGFDLVQPVRAKVNGTEIMKTVNFLNDENTIADNDIQQGAFVTKTELKDYAGTGVDKMETTRNRIVNIANLTSNEAFQMELGAEYAAAFGPTQSISQQVAYVNNNLGIAELPPGFKDEYGSLENFLAKAPDESKLQFVKNALQADILQSSFPPLYMSQKQYNAPKTIIEPAEGDLLEYLQKNNFTNEFGKPYVEGDNVYMIQEQTLENKPEDDGSEGTEKERLYKSLYDDLKNRDKDFDYTEYLSGVRVPGNELQFLKYFEGDGFYFVNKDEPNTKTGTKITSPEAIYARYQ